MAEYEFLPEKERLRRAVRWLGEQHHPVTFKDIEVAGQEFDLSPADEEFLLRNFLQSPRARAPASLEQPDAGP